jgi:hypothetical protein
MLIISFTAFMNSATQPIHAALRLLEGNNRKSTVLKKITSQRLRLLVLGVMQWCMFFLEVEDGD